MLTIGSVQTTIMNDYQQCPFLTNAQWEELETMGQIPLTDEIMDAMFAWANGEEVSQWSGLGHA